MELQAISSLISCAKAHEQQSQHLFSLVQSKLNTLHHTIELPRENGSEALMTFVLEYIDHLPDFLKAMEKASSELSGDDFIYPFLNIIEENFMAPILQSRMDVGLYEILEKSYFTHRLIEEVNDTYQSRTGHTLIPMDMTWPNLIVHEILGEAFGNELDSIVEQTVKHMMRLPEVYDEEKFRLYIERRNPETWIEAWSHWHSLGHQMGVDLKLSASA